MPLTILYAAIPNSFSTNFICATVSPFATRLALPFLIMSIASIPRSVLQAVRTDLYPLASHVRRFTFLWFALPQTATPPDGAILFQLLDGRWICAVLIDVDDPGRQVAGTRQGPTEEAFRRRSITFGSQKEIDGLPRGIDRSIELSLLAFHLNVSFIEAPALVGGL